MRAALATLLALLLAACGGERSFEPAEFVDAANREGANLVLGDPLTSTQEGVDIFAVHFAGEASEPAADDHAAGGGSMVVAEDAETATGEFERCESAVTLTCYRAANVVLYFDAESTDRRVAAVAAAIRALASD